jgi:hypothetical protein
VGVTKAFGAERTPASPTTEQGRQVDYVGDAMLNRDACKVVCIHDIKVHKRPSLQHLQSDAQHSQAAVQPNCCAAPPANFMRQLQSIPPVLWQMQVQQA